MSFSLAIHSSSKFLLHPPIFLSDTGLRQPVTGLPACTPLFSGQKKRCPRNLNVFGAVHIRHPDTSLYLMKRSPVFYRA